MNFRPETEIGLIKYRAYQKAIIFAALYQRNNVWFFTDKSKHALHSLLRTLRKTVKFEILVLDIQLLKLGNRIELLAIDLN